MVYNQIFGVKLEYGIHNTPKQVDVIERSQVTVDERILIV